jgi:hypothetical protein
MTCVLLTLGALALGALACVLALGLALVWMALTGGPRR